MLRPLLLVPALATAAVLASTPVAAAPTPESQAHFAYIEFGLPADHGLHGHIETSSEGITLEIARKNHFVTYRAQGESTETDLKVQFGGLGTIDVAFTPTETRTEEPPKGCTGPPSTSSTGVFTGVIDFTGEREYVHIATTQVKGWLAVYRESEWTCRRRARRVRSWQTSPPMAEAARRRSKPKGEPATLGVIGRSCSCLFAAISDPERSEGRPRFFYGLEAQEAEGLESFA